MKLFSLIRTVFEMVSYQFYETKKSIKGTPSSTCLNDQYNLEEQFLIVSVDHNQNFPCLFAFAQ